MNREKGVATTPCPGCGADLPVAGQPDGSLAASACPRCHPPARPEQASYDPFASREQGNDEDNEDEDNEDGEGGDEDDE